MCAGFLLCPGGCVFESRERHPGGAEELLAAVLHLALQVVGKSPRGLEIGDDRRPGRHAGRQLALIAGGDADHDVEPLVCDVLLRAERQEASDRMRDLCGAQIGVLSVEHTGQCLPELQGLVGTGAKGLCVQVRLLGSGLRDLARTRLWRRLRLRLVAKTLVAQRAVTVVERTRALGSGRWQTHDALCMPSHADTLLLGTDKHK